MYAKSDPASLPHGLLIVLVCGIGMQMLIGSCQKSEEKPKISLEQEILNSAEPWMGTPYKLGGTTLEGIDCSAFTQVVYKEVFQVDLPRRVKEQKRLGLSIPREEMQPGDLVVFKTGVFFSNKQHIGIYLSDDKFLHASSSKGVTISSLEEPFWNRKYRSSRRLVNESGEPDTGPQVAAQ